MRYPFILAEKAQFPVTMLCRVPSVSRSGFYAWCRHPAQTEKTRERSRLVNKVTNIHTEVRQSYGSRRIAQALQDQGHAVGRYQARSLMREAGIEVRRRRRYRTTTDSAHSQPVAPNTLDRQFVAQGPDQAWVADITYLWTAEGWLYLAAVLDLYSRRVVGGRWPTTCGRNSSRTR